MHHLALEGLNQRGFSGRSGRTKRLKHMETIENPRKTLENPRKPPFFPDLGMKNTSDLVTPNLTQGLKVFLDRSGLCSLMLKRTDARR